MMNNNIDYDTFVRNLPNPIAFSDIFNDALSDTLFSSSFSTSPIPNSFNISSFNVNSLKTPGQGSFKIDQISSFFSQNHISFGGIVDTHLLPKQMKFLSKRVCDYTSFHSDLDFTKHGHSSGSVSLFIHNFLATHVQFYQSHSSRILSVDLFFKGNVKLRIFVVYISPTNDLVLRYEVIDQLISLISQTFSQNFHHAICGDFNMNLEKYYPIFLHQPQVAAKRIHKLFHYLLSHNYKDCTPLNLSSTLASIFNAYDMYISNHNPIITYFNASLLSDAIKFARARQLGHNTRRIFKYDSISTDQWSAFAVELDNLCPVDPFGFDA
ncbi:hypothetical protein RirG_136250 [Rhizophagus irregularis DAOM 197198w]|uniref:DNase I-like protein n=1 Tax=Rhizophagus irregularis (strain DAOM 197198w) TaxID=1432141 RepID=A0A015J6J5_RHIIW|nr:hypothetical protein RirG_136250 [Rhizophagus irregularis DAOM 197198w]